MKQHKVWSSITQVFLSHLYLGKSFFSFHSPSLSLPFFFLFLPSSLRERERMFSPGLPCFVVCRRQSSETAAEVACLYVCYRLTNEHSQGKRERERDRERERGKKGKKRGRKRKEGKKGELCCVIQFAQIMS